MIRNAKVRTKLLVLSITAFAFLLLVDFIALVGINKLFGRIEHFHKENVIPLSFVSDMRGSFHATRANVMDVILAENDESRKELIEGPNALNDSFEYFSNAVFSYQTYVESALLVLDGEREAVTALVNALDATERVVNQIISASSREEALYYATGEFRDVAYNQILPNVQKLNALHVNETALQMELSLDEKNIISALLLGLTAFNALALIFISYIIIRSINVPLQEMIKIAEHVSNGKLRINIKYRSKDELGVLAERFRNMIAAFEQLSFSISDMGKRHDIGEWDFRIRTDALEGAYREIAESINNNSDDVMQMFQELMLNMSDLANGKFDTVIKDYPGQKRMASETMSVVKTKLQNINREVTILAESGLSGNLTHRVNVADFQGDWGKLMESLNKFLEAVDRPIKEISDALNQISKGNLSAQLHGSYKGDFEILQRTLNNTSRNLSHYIGDISETVKQLVDNNLDLHVKGDYAGDYSVIKESLNTLIEKLNNIFTEINKVSNRISSDIEQIAELGMLLAQGATKQSYALKGVMADVDICTKQTAEDGKNAEIACTISDKSKSDITISNQKMKDMLQSMDEILEAAGNISKFNKVIEDIAFQTNLLALNAAVEAARAGYHGKGFAVVAEEVRTLANRCKKASSETTELIDDTINRVNSGTDLANTMALSLEEMVEGIHTISDLMKVIDESGAIQSEGFSRAVSGLEKISQVVKNNSDISEKNAVASEELFNQAEELQKLIKSFKLRKN